MLIINPLCNFCLCLYKKVHAFRGITAIFVCIPSDLTRNEETNDLPAPAPLYCDGVLRLISGWDFEPG